MLRQILIFTFEKVQNKSNSSSVNISNNALEGDVDKGKYK
jgi:hypothetical protein